MKKQILIHSLEELAIYINKNVQSGNEIIINDSLHFGCGLYAWKSDNFIFTGVETEEGNNNLFLHIKETYNNIFTALKNLFCRDGYIDLDTINIKICF